MQQLFFNIFNLSEVDNTELLQKQITLSDILLLKLNQDDLMIAVFTQLIQSKAWHCKLIIRFLMRLNNKNHASYFKKTVEMMRNLLKNGICEDLRRKTNQPEEWFNTKRGLALFMVTMFKSKDEASDLYHLFSECISSKIRDELTSEYD